MKYKHTPAIDDLTHLPRLAGVAFAVRCARRVYPLFNSKRYNNSVVIAISWVESHAACGGTADPGESVAVVADAFTAAGQAQTDAKRYEQAKSNASKTATIQLRRTLHTEEQVIYNYINLACAARGEYHAATAAAEAATAVLDLRQFEHIALAVKNAALAGAAVMRMEQTVRAIWLDLERLSKLSQAEKWTDTTTVPSDLFGPLWSGTSPWGTWARSD